MTDYTNDIERYLRGEMSAGEQYTFEKKALSDPFLAEALEGAEQLLVNKFVEDVAVLKEKVSRAVPVEKQKSVSIWIWTARIAAGIVLILVPAYLIWNMHQSIGNESPIALQETKSGFDAAEIYKDSTHDKYSEAIESEDELIAIIPETTAQSKSLPPEPQAIAPKTQTQSEGAEKPTEIQPNLAQVKPQEETLKSPAQLKTIPQEMAEKEEREKVAGVVAKKELTEDLAKRQAVSRAAPLTETVQNVIKGKVTSADDGSPLPGVNVVIKGSTLGTVTDASGYYQVEVAGSSPTLVFSFIGLRSTEVNAHNQKEVNVQMDVDAAQLSEVVVVGYGTAPGEHIRITVDLAHPEIGNRAFKKYLEENIRYPEEALESKVEGRITVEFVVDEDGNLDEFNVVRGIGAGCDEELVRLIKEGPKWIPTKKSGTPVRDKARVRLRFVLPK